MQKSIKRHTRILNTVLQANIDPTCLAVWCSLQSLPNNWNLQVNEIRAQFGLGRDKVYKVLKKLIAYNLLERVHQRNENGTFGEVVYIVQDGNEFKHSLSDFQ
jgi:predicted transcriptional regulator